jgi:hypothetical protein
MRRKLFCGISLFAMVFATCMSGYAQTLTTCQPCDKCTPWHIRAAGCTAVDPQLGGGSVAVPFDWDATYGYCEQSGAATLPAYQTPGYNNTAQRRCRAVLDICTCEDACDFAEGWVLGVQMQIVDQNGAAIPGVYFTNDPDVPMFSGVLPAAAYTADPNAFDDLNAANTVCYSANSYQLRFRRLPKVAHTTPCTTTSFLDGYTANVDNINATLGARTSYDTMKVTYFTNAGVVTAPGNNNATSLRTVTPYDAYELTPDDIRRQLCNWWFDVPAMIASGTAMSQSGQHVYVKISLLASAPLNTIIPNALERRDYLRPENADPALPPVEDVEALRTFSIASPPYQYGTPPYQSQGQFWEWIPCGLLAGQNQDCTGLLAGFDGDNDGLTHRDAGATAADTNLVGTGACEWEWDQRFCPDCASPCSCLIDLGILCCPTDPTIADTYCLTFPYVTQYMANWETGIGLTRLCPPANGATPTVTLRLTDCTGTTFTHTINPTAANENLQCIFINDAGALRNGGVLVSQMVDWYPGWSAAAAGQAMLRVEANFKIGGYQFNMFSNGTQMYGAGVMPWAGCATSCAAMQ